MLFFGVAEQQGLIKDNSGAYDVTVVAVPHAPLPSDPLLATRFYTGDPNDPKDGIRRAALPSDQSRPSRCVRLRPEFDAHSARQSASDATVPHVQRQVSRPGFATGSIHV